MYTLADYEVGDTVRVVDHRPDDWAENPVFTDQIECRCGSIGKVVNLNSARNWVVIQFSNFVSWTFKPNWLIPMKDLEYVDTKKTSVANNFYEYLKAKKVV